MFWKNNIIKCNQLKTLKKKEPSFLKNIIQSSFLTAIRAGLTLSFPVVVVGTIALFINSLPFEWYQKFMLKSFGVHWQSVGLYVYNGTFGIIALVMAFSVSFSLANNAKLHEDTELNPIIVLLVSLCSIFTIFEPIELNDGVLFLNIRWFGTHGLLFFLVHIFLAGFIFKFFYSFKFLHISISSSSDSNQSVINYSLKSVIPAILTIFLFGIYKALSKYLGIYDLGDFYYAMICFPFKGLEGSEFLKANIYSFFRDLLWFFGIHGSNVLEPVMTEIFASNKESVFSRSFFNCFIAIGGSGASFGLLIAVLLGHSNRGVKKICKISILPTLFNINEMLLLGIPVILNPIFLIPFIVTPIVLTSISYLAVSFSFVPVPSEDVLWNMPILYNAFLATGGSWPAVILQLFNILVATLIYLPFVRLDNKLRESNLEKTLCSIIKETYDTEFHGLWSDQNLTDRLVKELNEDLIVALDKREMFLVYQPQVNSSTGESYGVEALLRWRHPYLGLIPPSIFVNIAEEAGYFDKLGFWALDEAIFQCSKWHGKLKNEDFIMSVNVSALQLENEKFDEEVIKILEIYGVSAKNLKLEITEKYALTNKEQVNRLLLSLVKAGVRISVDDFGMGHASLNYISQLPIDSLKLDYILSRDILDSHSSREIIVSIVELCKRLNIKLVAEYVEDEEHLLKLRELGCYRIQGYIYSEPLEADLCLEFINKKVKGYGKL